jgi:membrane protein DedA with SNARE-associated domain
MHWTRFVIANALGGIVWATFYGVAAFELSSAITKLSTPVEIGFGALAVVVIIAAAIFVRINIKRLEVVAEAALPGPLEGFSS